MIPKIVQEFLQESNEIEGVFDFDSINQASYAWEYLIKCNHLSNKAILRTHKILMLHQSLQEHEKGAYRSVPVYIAGRECPVQPGGLNLTFVMQDWCVGANKDLENWKEWHIKFEKIHPFVDGNGRIGRMLMNWMRVKWDMPVLVIKANERQEYYKWFL